MYDVLKQHYTQRIFGLKSQYRVKVFGFKYVLSIYLLLLFQNHLNYVAKYRFYHHAGL